jgi:hypothetical protein
MHLLRWAPESDANSDGFSNDGFYSIETNAVAGPGRTFGSQGNRSWVGLIGQVHGEVVGHITKPAPRATVDIFREITTQALATNPNQTRSLKPIPLRRRRPIHGGRYRYRRLLHARGGVI